MIHGVCNKCDYEQILSFQEWKHCENGGKIKCGKCDGHLIDYSEILALKRGDTDSETKN